MTLFAIVTQGPIIAALLILMIAYAPLELSAVIILTGLMHALDGRPRPRGKAK